MIKNFAGWLSVFQSQRCSG